MMRLGPRMKWDRGWEGESNFELKTQFAFEPSFGAGDCRRDQRWLEAHTLFVTYIRVRDKAVWGGSWRLGSWMRVREVGMKG